MAGDTSLSKCCRTDTPIGSPVEAVEKPTDNAPPLSAWLTLILRSIGHRWLRRFPPFFDGNLGPVRITFPILVPLPLHRDAGAIADLDPDRARTGAIGAVDLL